MALRGPFLAAGLLASVVIAASGLMARAQPADPAASPPGSEPVADTASPEAAPETAAAEPAAVQDAPFGTDGAGPPAGGPPDSMSAGSGMPSDAGWTTEEVYVDSALSSAAGPPRRKRRALIDVGQDSATEWVPASPSSAAAADAALIERAQRRERAMDPAKKADLQRLSRLLGAMHAMRVSCAGRDDQTWRSRMATLLDLEAPGGGEMRDPLVDAFNSGFQAEGRGSAACPADSRAKEAALARQGRALALSMAARYQPPPAKTDPPAESGATGAAASPPAQATAQ